MYEPPVKQIIPMEESVSRVELEGHRSLSFDLSLPRRDGTVIHFTQKF